MEDSDMIIQQKMAEQAEKIQTFAVMVQQNQRIREDLEEQLASKDQELSTMKVQAKNVIVKLKADHKDALAKCAAGGAGGAGGGGDVAEKQEEVDALKAQLEKMRSEARTYLEKQKKMHQEELARAVADAGGGGGGGGGAGGDEALRGGVVGVQGGLEKTKVQAKEYVKTLKKEHQDAVDALNKTNAESEGATRGASVGRVQNGPLVDIGGEGEEVMELRAKLGELQEMLTKVKTDARNFVMSQKKKHDDEVTALKITASEEITALKLTTSEEIAALKLAASEASSGTFARSPSATGFRTGSGTMLSGTTDEAAGTPADDETLRQAAADAAQDAANQRARREAAEGEAEAAWGEGERLRGQVASLTAEVAALREDASKEEPKGEVGGEAASLREEVEKRAAEQEGDVARLTAEVAALRQGAQGGAGLEEE
ncbi:hypothetical protein T484DRAFT_1827998, partial [Baffinella frigidus]